MKRNKFWAAGSMLVAIILTLAITLMLAPCAVASNYKVLHQFTGEDGYGPYAALILDQYGNLYGTTPNGGTYNWGVVFELSPNPDGSWTETVLYNFTGGDDGSYPDHPSLVFDAGGNLYGTTYGGGGQGGCTLFGNGCGTVFELSPNADGTWTESVLHSFTSGADGGWPEGTPLFDAAGNLYGTTTQGGAYGYGTVFTLAPNPDGTWSEAVLHSFADRQGDGANPWTGVIFDASGNIYGTTNSGGRGYGNVFELVSSPGGVWTESVLHQFSDGKDGAFPDAAALLLDGTGALYGAANQGGAYGYGDIFKLTPNPDGTWKDSVLHQFTRGADGANPWAGLIRDAAGNLYGTAESGGTHGYGIVFKLVPTQNGGWSGKVLHEFTGGSGGAYPFAALTLDSAGNLYGVTRGLNNGLVYEITP